jgi:phosphate transport system substrate-binding protein
MRLSLRTALLGTLTALLGVALLPGCNPGGGSSGGGTAGGAAAVPVSSVKLVRAGGSTFIEPMMDVWSKLYSKEKGVKVDYAGGGSGKGVTQMSAGNYDFGCTDAPMNEKQLAEAKGPVVHIPLVLGAVVPAYNLKGIDQPLKFDGAVLADIYLGKIKKWNDPALVKLNGDAKLPDKEIVVVHRAEPSGTTFIWTNYLSKASDEWKKEVGSGTDVKWKVGNGQKGTDGVTALVAATDGAIGYIEAAYALKNKDKVNFGSVANRKGKQIRGDTAEAVTVAAEGAEIPDNLCVILTDSDNENAYPIVGCPWAVFYQTPKDKEKGKALLDFVRWVVHEGQQHVTKPDYAPLPEKLVKAIDQKLDAVQVK